MKEKTIKTTIILAEGEFDGGGNTATIEGLATTVQVQKNGLPEKNTAHVEIKNLSLAHMSQLTFLSFKNLESKKNHILIEAGDKGGTLAVVFKGDITNSWADFSTSPDVTFKADAITAGWALQMNTSPTSVDGEAPAADLIQQFAGEAGFGFINNGVSEQVRNATFNGDPVSKARAVADEIGAELIIDDENFLLQPYDKAQGEAVLLNPASGLIGYPGFTANGISLDCFYDPKLQLGGQVKVESIVPAASGYWKIFKLTHSLTAYTQGEWRSHIEGAALDG